MADATSSIFNKKAAEKLRSPDDLDKYVQVTNPSVWVILAACIAFLIGMLAWGAFGDVETSVETTGAVVETGQAEPRAICLVTADEIERIAVGNVAEVGGVEMTVSDAQTIPVSADEVSKMLNSDYLFNALMKDDWAYIVTFEGDISQLAPDVPLRVKITVERMAPLSLIFKHNG